MKEKVLFITNAIYLDKTKKEGGVRLCTEEYIQLLEEHFEVILFPVQYNIDLYFRIKVRAGLNSYNDYKASDYEPGLQEVITKNHIGYVFLNLSNTIRFAEVIKRHFKDSVKVILCSHGNESGDYLHEITRFKSSMGGIKNLFSTITLGRMLKIEATYRQRFIDLVLTVSPVEEEIENWIGAKKVMMVPRVINSNPLDWKPVIGRVGFMGDLSHWPNFHGIDSVCKELEKLNTKTEIRLLGNPEKKGMELSGKYPFVKYQGFLNDTEILTEAASWSFFLNPVLYYSRGVSTKLAKALGWGIPVITTLIGCRGYVWKGGSLVTVDNAKEMAKKINELSWNMEAINIAKKETDKVVNSTILISDISEILKEALLVI